MVSVVLDFAVVVIVFVVVDFAVVVIVFVVIDDDEIFRSLMTPEGWWWRLRRGMGNCLSLLS